MRRKGKRGIVTNRTIKLCKSCDFFCSSCKGVCKVQYGSADDQEYTNENHLQNKKSGFEKKLHQIGIGSLAPGKKFIQYDPRGHKDFHHDPHGRQRTERMLKREKNIDLLEDILTYNLECYD